MVFVDTGAWIAVMVQADAYHEAAKTCYRRLLSRRLPLVASNYVFDETLTRIRYDAGHAAACRFLDLYEEAEERRLLVTLYVDEDVTRQALQLFRKYSDQEFSFTDCTSFVLMERHAITEAFAFDNHFETMGFLRQPFLPHR
jgi:predicted nucleic acid-binding protein